MASMASSRTGNPCTSFGSVPLPAPVSRSLVLCSSFGTTASKGVSPHRSGAIKRVSRDSVASPLREVATPGNEKILNFKNLSSGIVRFGIICNSECGEGRSEIVSPEVSHIRWNRADTICRKLKQYAAAGLLLSSLHLTCNESVWAIESSSNSWLQESKRAETTTVGLSSEPSKFSGASLSLDLTFPAADSTSQVVSVPDETDASTSSKPSSGRERAPELSNPDCGRSSIATVVENVLNNSEPVTNESVVEEAWEVVNENFLDARRHSWSADDWLKKKEEVLKRPLRSRMAAYGAIKAMLATLNDPYTRFLTPDQFLQLSKYDVTGVGLNIGEVEENGTSSLRVLGIVLGSPAQNMGVRQGDELVAVNGTSVRGMTAFEAASLIQGPKGTPVSIQIRHGPCEEVQTLKVAREQDVRTPVFYRLERTQNNRQLTGYIRLKEFNALAKRDLLTAMKRLQDAGAASFLLDLQDNPGGLVQAGIEIARLFLDGGETVIQTVGRDPTDYKSIMATGVPFTKAPLMVLVNDRTASASEIVAAALHDNCRAVLVGNRTFGKGLIQSVYELSDGSGIILTVGKYVTPGHIDIDGNGIEPDFRNPPGLSEAMDKLASCEMKLESVSSASSNVS